MHSFAGALGQGISGAYGPAGVVAKSELWFGERSCLKKQKWRKL